VLLTSRHNFNFDPDDNELDELDANLYVYNDDHHRLKLSGEFVTALIRSVDHFTARTIFRTVQHTTAHNSQTHSYFPHRLPLRSLLACTLSLQIDGCGLTCCCRHDSTPD
jgi:hypothetical protein